MIRTSVVDIRLAGRATRGVIVFRVDKDEKVVSVSSVRDNDDNGRENSSGDFNEKPTEEKQVLGNSVKDDR